MKRIFLALALSAIFLPAAAQDGPKPQSAQPAAPQLTAEHQQRIAAAVERARRAATDERAALQNAQALQGDSTPQQFREKAADAYHLARAKRELADAQLSAEGFYVMALLKASPEEWELRPAQGGGFVL